MAGSAGPFGRVMGEAVAVAVAACPDAAAPSVRGLTLRPPKVNGGREGASPAGLVAAKEKPDAEGKIDEVEEAALKEKREEELEGRLKEGPEEEEAGAAGAAVEAGGAEVEASGMEGIRKGVNTGAGGLDAAGACGGGADSDIIEMEHITVLYHE